MWVEMVFENPIFHSLLTIRAANVNLSLTANICLRPYNGSNTPPYNIFCSLPRPSIRSVEDIDPEMV